MTCLFLCTRTHYVWQNKKSKKEENKNSRKEHDQRNFLDKKQATINH